MNKNQTVPLHLQSIFDIVKYRFPQIDVQAINPQLPLNENLHNILRQVGLPSSLFQIKCEINNMKQAVDQQQLKIQTSLINQQNQDALKVGRRNVRQSESMSQDSEDQREYLGLKRKAGTFYEQHYNYQNPQIMEQIWQFHSESVHTHRDWFQK